jgi:sugar lactone lactonase YvrE
VGFLADSLILPQMRMLLRLAILLWITAGWGFGQSTLSVNVPGNIESVLKVDLPPGEGQPATTFPIGFMTNVAAAPDVSGNIYFASGDHHRVYRVTQDGRLFLFAGTENGYSGDGGAAAQARLRNPAGVAVDRSGTVYIGDGGNNVIRKVSPQGIITTMARGISTLRALTVDDAGNLFVAVAYRVLKVTPDGSVTSFAGTGSQGFSGDGGPALNAAMGLVEGIAVDRVGNVFISDNSNHRVRKISAEGIITTVAGNGVGGYSGNGGPAVAANLYQPRGLAFDGGGNLYVGDYFNHMVRRVNTAGIITTAAGTFVGNSPLGTGGFAGDGGHGLLAVLRNPMGIAIDPSGNLYIADSNNRRIRKVAALTGTISTFAGNGLLGGGKDTQNRTIAVSPSGEVYVSGLGRVVYRVVPGGSLEIFAGTDTFDFAGDGGPAKQASFRGPNGLAVDSAGAVYIADSSNHRIRKVGVDGRIVTVAGSGANGFGGDGGPALAASLSTPYAIAVDKDGALYIGDNGNLRIRKVTPDGIIRTIAGNGQMGFNGDGLAVGASLNGVSGIVVDASGAVIISDSNNQRVRKITPDGQLRTIAGTGNVGYNGDGPALSVNFFTPWGLALDPEGTLYIADTNNTRIRRLTAAGNIETIAGYGTQGFAGDGGPARLAQFSGATGVAWYPSGELYIADSSNGAIRRVAIQPTARFSISHLGAASSTSPGDGSVSATGYASVFTFANGHRPAGVAVLSSRDKGITVSETTFAATPAILSGRVAAEVRGSVNTGIAIANPNDSAANISFFFTNANGDFGSGSFTINARNQHTAFLTEKPFNVPAPMEGTFTFTSSVPVAVTVMRGLVNERSEFLATALPITDLSALPANAPIAIPHYASGGGWTTRITLVNPSDQSISGTVGFTNPAGNITGAAQYAITPRGSLTLPLHVNLPGTNVGRILVTPITGVAPTTFALLSYVDAGVTVTSTAVPAVPSASAIRMFAEIAGDVETGAPGSAQTGVAIANMTDSPVQVTLTVGPGPSNPFLSERFAFTLPANGQFAAFLKDILPKNIPVAPMESVLRLQASGPIAAVGLRTRINERRELLVSSTPTIDETAPPSTEPFYFPLFADSASFATRFILFSGTPISTSIGTLRFFSPSGQLITLLQ